MRMAVQRKEDLESEYVTGDQLRSYRLSRGFRRPPSWAEVESWRQRWSRTSVLSVLQALADGATAEVIALSSGYGLLDGVDVHGRKRAVPDLRGLDLAILEPNERRIPWKGPPDSKPSLDLAYFHLEGSRLTDLDLSGANLSRAFLQKATLRRVKFRRSNLSKAHLEDADLRDAILEDANLAHIRYTTDGFWSRGTVLMETHLNRALYVDPVLERTAKDQYYIYVLRYRNRDRPLGKLALWFWRWTSNYGNSLLLWAAWSVFLILGFAAVFHFLLGPRSFAASNLPRDRFETMAYFSVVTFTTLGFGDVVPHSMAAAWWVIAEVITGYLMLGGLISIFAAKIARRS